MAQYVLLSNGEYSSYGVTDLLAGPDEPTIQALMQRFSDEYAPKQTKVRTYARGAAYGVPSSEEYRDWEGARVRLEQEGAPVKKKPGYYGWTREPNSVNDALFVAWLLATQGWRKVEYIEMHEGILRD